MNKTEILNRIKGGLIVSCQAEPEKGSQLYEPRDIARTAKEVLQAGACAVRICGVENIRETREVNSASIIIGITKSNYPDGRVLITQDLDSINGIILAGADIVGMDMTKRERPHGISSVDLYSRAKEIYPDKIFIVDISDKEECAAAIKAGVDIVGTTLSGYTSYTENRLRINRWYEYEPDFELLEDLVKSFPDIPIIAEGRYRNPEQCYEAIHRYGAFTVCVGSQVTRPREIVRWHLQAIEESGFL